MRRRSPGCGCYERDREPGQAGGAGRRPGPGAVRVQAPDGGLLPPAARQGPGRGARLAGAGAGDERGQDRSAARDRAAGRIHERGAACAGGRPRPVRGVFRRVCRRHGQRRRTRAPAGRCRRQRSRNAGDGAPASGCRTSPCCSMPCPDGWRRGSRRSRRNARPASCASSACRRPTCEATEPFGFVDGISQPEVDWERKRPVRDQDQLEYSNLTCLGEFLLGYPNEYGLYTPRPLLAPQRDPDGLLPRAEDAPDQADLGRNGCYLVMRQLQQDVQGFWRELDRQAGGDADLRERLAAAMVGRTKDGEPLAVPSGESGGAARRDRNRTTSPTGTIHEGLRCPLGAHIRRANPRNADLPPGGRGHPVAAVAHAGIRRGGAGAGSGRLHAFSSPAAPRTGSTVQARRRRGRPRNPRPARRPGSTSSASWPTSSASSSSCRARG